MRSTENSKAVFLADTYALIEMFKGNAQYEEHSRALLVTTVFNLAELYYYLLREHTREIANKYCSSLTDILAPVTLNVIAVAMHLRLANKEQRLSYADCVGYALAQEQGIPFLTGDVQFEGRPGVEFVR